MVEISLPNIEYGIVGIIYDPIGAQGMHHFGKARESGRLSAARRLGCLLTAPVFQATFPPSVPLFQGVTLRFF